MGKNDGLALNLGKVTVFASQHINLALIHSQLTNISLEKEHIGTLHQWVQNLSRCQGAFQSSHDLATLFDACNVEASRHVQHERPVGSSLFRNFFAGPLEDDVVQIHTGSLPHLLQIFSHDANLVQIATHLVIHQSKPIGNPKDKGSPGRRALVDIHGLENTLCNVHATAGFKTVIEIESCITFCQEEGLEFIRGNALFSH
mmetsp:Transcript_12891/g.21384  ORF Transcript_12891/g.21384 Transcript_12891/m.21384 type:complete len:201 (+) Transcript_12891:1768-2370(+)